MIPRSIPHFFSLLLVTGLFFDGGEANAQQRLTPEQAETVRQLKEQLLKSGGGVCFIRDSKRDKTTVIEEQFKDIDPILVGRNIVFSKNWLKHIGPNKQIARQIFTQWRMRCDKIYDCYEKLTGGPPTYGKKVFWDTFKFTQPHHIGAAHAHGYSMCYGEPDDAMWEELQKAMREGQVIVWMIHELSHVFSFGKEWDVAPETSVAFLTTYFLENTDMWYGTGGTPPRHYGTLARKQWFGETLAAYKSNAHSLETFANTHNRNVWVFYFWGLVDKVGWQPYEKAFQSYNDTPLKLAANIGGEDRRKARARDFLERIAKFSGKPNVLRSLPDKGKLLDEHLTPLTLEERAANLFPGWSIKNCEMNPHWPRGMQESYRRGKNVLETHPLSREIPCTLERRMDIPVNRKTFLRMVVSNYPNCDWDLVCRVNGSVQKTVTIDDKLTKSGWTEEVFDLTSFAGKKNVLIELENKANGWHHETAYWASLTVGPSPSGQRADWMYSVEGAVAELFPGWSLKNCENNPDWPRGMKDNYRGKRNVLETHPTSQEVPCTLEYRTDIPAGKKTVLRVVVSNYPNADWELVCRVNGSVHRVVTINDALTKGGWADGVFDLTPFAGRKNVLIELENKANSWYHETGFWASLTIQSR
jgi:hypothetical protein